MILTARYPRAVTTQNKKPCDTRLPRRISLSQCARFELRLSYGTDAANALIAIRLTVANVPMATHPRLRKTSWGACSALSVGTFGALVFQFRHMYESCVLVL